MAEYKFLDDLAKFGNSTMTAMGGFQRQVSRWVAEQTTTLVKGMDIVTKQEIEAYKLTVAQLEERIAKLEGKLNCNNKPEETASEDSEAAERPAVKRKTAKK